jgi:molybdopterin-guanine dinucleotide biosynthesis protein A
MSGAESKTAAGLALGAVLAGGEGRRMGTAKAALRLGERPLIYYPLAALAAAGLDHVVVAKERSQLPAISCPVLREPPTPSHPLCGVLAALRAAARPVLVVGCDMPFLTAPLLAWLAGLDGAVVAEVAGELQPLPARYEPQQTGELEDALRDGRAMRDALASLRPRIVRESELERFGPPETSLFNVNDATDLAAAERMLGIR